MAAKLMNYFNKSPRIGSLSAASKKGIVNAAMFGSPKMLDEKTVVMGLGKDRTLKNLQENPRSVFMIIEPGKTLGEWKGIRVYLKMKACATSGPQLDDYRSHIAKSIGEGCGKKDDPCRNNL